MNSKKYVIAIFASLFIVGAIYGRNIEGIVLCKESQDPIRYANIGIENKNIGTVSNDSGRFVMEVGSNSFNDSLLISCIGYENFYIKISEFDTDSEKVLLLTSVKYNLKEVVIKPRKIKPKLFGISTKSKKIHAGFKQNNLGYECGVLMSSNKVAHLKKVKINIASCSYDTIFYRVNVYKQQNKSSFKNILREPIYVVLPNSQLKDEIEINMIPYNVVVKGNFLITLEYIKKLGNGHLDFCAKLFSKSYYRKTSQANWESVPVGISISALAEVE